MNNQKFFSIENGKDDFSEMVRIRYQYKEKKRELVRAIRKIEIEIEKIDGKISQTVDELTTSFLMRKSKKEKKYRLIENLKEDKAAGQENIKGLEEQISELKMETFGSLDLPKICFGKYYFGADGELKPLQWKVIRIKENRALMLSSFVIEQMPYADEIVDTPWKESVIRSWLNEKFFNDYFSEEEQKMIIETEIPNPGNDAYNTAESSNTLDKIFLFSLNDVRRYYEFDIDRIAHPTGHAKARGVYENEETKGAYWWLRSNGGNMYNASVVNFSGYVFDYGFYVNSEEFGIRPALWIDLS